MEIEELINIVMGEQLLNTEESQIDLTGVGLSSEQLKELIPEMKKEQNLTLILNDNPTLKELPEEIKELTNLRKIKVKNCNLHSLPSQIKELSNLELLDLSNNKLEFLPSEICELNKLRTILMSKNKIQELPANIGTLNNLAFLDVSNNSLENLPNSLLSNAVYHESLCISAYDNPNLSEDEQRTILDNFKRRPIVDLDPETQVVEVGVLGEIYGRNSTSVRKKIDGLDLDKVRVGDENELIEPNRVILDLVSKIPFKGMAAEAIYLPATKKLINDVVNEKLPKEDRQAVIEKIAIALGNCATPVKSFLTQVAIGEKLNSGEELPEHFKGLIIAEGFEDMFRREFKEELKNNKESTELLAGLSNLVFLKDAANYEHYPFKVKGNVIEVTTSSSSTDFGFSMIKGNKNIERKFVELCCNTNKKGKGIKDRKGSYTISTEKYNAIVEQKLAELGIISEREKKINRFEKEIKGLLSTHNLISYYDKQDVLPFLDVPKLKNELRLALQAAPDKDINTIVGKCMVANAKSISDLGRKYEKKEQLNMSKMTKSTAKLTTGKKTVKSKIKSKMEGVFKVIPKKKSPSL